MKGQFEKYTSETAQVLPVVEATDEQVAQLKTRIDQFRTAVETGKTPEALILTADEINAMIANEKELRGKLFVKIADGQISGDVSIPVGDRFFNGSATFDATLVNGVLFVNLKDATVKGEKLPQTFIDQMSGENLAKEVNKNPEVSKFLKGLESLSIEGDKIIMTPKASNSDGIDTSMPEATGETEPAETESLTDQSVESAT